MRPIPAGKRRTLARAPRFALNAVLFLLPCLAFTAWFARLAEQKNQSFELWTKLELEEK